MTTDSQKKTDSDTVKLATFYVGEALCGIDILHIQEINKLMDMTVVPQAPHYVQGILNLRGQIVTIIDLCKKLGLAKSDRDSRVRNIIIHSKGESIGLLVGRIGDVITSDTARLENPPANIGEIQGKYFTGVAKTENQLIGVLDLARVLEDKNDKG